MKRESKVGKISVTITYIIESTLSTDVEQSSREVTVRHLQTIVRAPQRRPERITDAGEAPTRSRISFKHQERFLHAFGITS